MYWLTNEWHENCSKGVYSYKELKELLIQEAEAEIKDNCGDEDCKDIVINNLEVLIKLAREDYTDEDYIIKELKLYGWIIYKLNDIKKMFNDMISYPTSEENKKAINDILKVLDNLK